MDADTLKAVLRAAYPQATQNNINTFAEPILACWGKYDISTMLRCAHWLAQIGHESGQLRYVEEIASGAAYEGRRDLGNVMPGDGRRFKGRGLIQLTGRFNYDLYGQAIGVDLLANPEIVASDPYLAVDVAGWFWARTGLNAWADRDDIRTITRRINGGFNGMEDRQRLLGLAKSALPTASGNSSATGPLTSRQIQSALNQSINAGLAEDGVIGPLTMAKIREFQQRNKLHVDGIVGPLTEAALREYL